MTGREEPTSPGHHPAQDRRRLKLLALGLGAVALVLLAVVALIVVAGTGALVPG